MKRKDIHVMLLPVLLLTACGPTAPPPPGPPAARQSGTRAPALPKVEPKPEPAPKEDPVLRAYRFNPTERPGWPFLNDDGSLGWGETFAHGFVLPPADGASVRQALANPTEAATEKNFRPQFAVMIFGKDKKPLRCIEVSYRNSRAQVQEASSGKRQELADADATRLMLVIEKHRLVLLSR